MERDPEAREPEELTQLSDTTPLWNDAILSQQKWGRIMLAVAAIGNTIGFVSEQRFLNITFKLAGVDTIGKVFHFIDENNGLDREDLTTLKQLYDTFASAYLDQNCSQHIANLVMLSTNVNRPIIDGNQQSQTALLELINLLALHADHHCEIIDTYFQLKAITERSQRTSILTTGIPLRKSAGEEIRLSMTSLISPFFYCQLGSLLRDMLFVLLQTPLYLLACNFDDALSSLCLTAVFGALFVFSALDALGGCIIKAFARKMIETLSLCVVKKDRDQVEGKFCRIKLFLKPSDSTSDENSSLEIEQALPKASPANPNTRSRLLLSSSFLLPCQRKPSDHSVTASMPELA